MTNKWNEEIYEWDEDKARLNFIKHGIRFETAISVFDDINRMEFCDAAHSIDEDRFNVIGMVDEVLFVVYTERREKIRLISARIANQRERRMYHDRNL